MLNLENILDRQFKVIPVNAESDLMKVVKVGADYYLKCPASRITCKAFWDGNEKFSYTFILGNNMHVGSIAFANMFFIEFDKETNLKTLKPQEYAAAKK